MITEKGEVLKCEFTLSELEFSPRTRTCPQVRYDKMMTHLKPLDGFVLREPRCNGLSKHVILEVHRDKVFCKWIPKPFDFGSFKFMYVSKMNAEIGKMHEDICLKFLQDCKVIILKDSMG